jgi:hypothetical protein
MRWDSARYTGGNAEMRQRGRRTAIDDRAGTPAAWFVVFMKRLSYRQSVVGRDACRVGIVPSWIHRPNGARPRPDTGHRALQNLRE